MKHFRAPWSTSLWSMSIFATVLLLIVPAACVFAGVMPASLKIGLWALSLGMIFGAALFTVRGYLLRPDCLSVERLFWSTHLPLVELQSARVDPNAMSDSLRTCGNGGLFSYTGWYWNRTLRSYRAFVTDPKRAVVLKFARRTIVVSPDAPEDFVREIASHRQDAGLET